VPGKNEWEGGQPGGLDNPLGARAMYLFQDGKDTLFRLHGSPEWDSIGKSVSSGCVRLLNQDIIDLYDRVPNKSPILVTSGLASV
jgi:lipoprotein-anchoring transpeptidase ErfK/SrfK